MTFDLSAYRTNDHEHGRQRRVLSIHVSGGKRINLTMDVACLDDVAERLRRERVLIGQMSFSDDYGDHLRDVLIPSSCIDFVVDADD